MKVIHQINRIRITGEGNNQFLLTNKKGNFFSIGKNTSYFHGLFHYSSFYEQFLKIISDIRIEGIPDTLINNYSWIERRTGSAKERFFLSSNALIYEIEDYKGPVVITLDIKKIYDESDFGKEYNIYNENNNINDDVGIFICDYTKHLNNSEDYKTTVVINQSGELLNNWRKVHLPYDADRNMRSERYVFDALKLNIEKKTRIIITFSHDKHKALEKLSYVEENYDEIIDAIKKMPLKRLPHEKKDLILASAINNLDSLITKTKKGVKGIYAGLPWFFQYWARDELFSLKALIIDGQYLLVKEILTKYFELYTDPDDTLSLNSADAPGLLCLRTYDLLTELKSKNLLKKYFSKMELNYIKEKTVYIYEQMKSKQDLYGFIINNPQDTWMDTITPLDIGRPGARIEIQMLFLRVYDLLNFFEIKKDNQELKRLLREWFINKNRILDGFFPDGQADERVRPNIFLAWYYYPKLFSNEEWEKAFDYVLKELWLEWGGLSSISKHDKLFLSSHSGLGDASYHRGDSWYFINNIAALAMFTINPHKYENYIEKIRTASENDLLYQGFIGHSSEISDAINQRARGCWSQAWSATSLIELIIKMRHNEYL